MEYLIQQFLKQNNLSGINGVDYCLQDDGDGPYIKRWGFNIPQPIFAEEDFNKEKLWAKKQQLIFSRTSYLKSSADYYAPDFTPEILAKRDLARNENKNITDTGSLEELENFSTSFE